MPRNITPFMAQRLGKPATALTRILKVMLRKGTAYGLCMTNKDVRYDDGTGELLYVATNGFDPSTIAADTTFGVDNAESRALLSDDIPGVTLEMVEAGDLDDAKWVCYVVDYENPLPGTHAIIDAGDLGEVYVESGMVWTPQLLSFMMRFKQAVGDNWSRTCRATFGTPAASHTGCGVDAEALWEDFVVASVGAESDRTFTIAPTSSNMLVPARVLWTTGKNAGRLFAVEELNADSSGNVEVTLMETTSYPIEDADAGTIRPDCDKTKVMCMHYNNYPNMKAEDTIPVSDSAAISVPGGQT